MRAIPVQWRNILVNWTYHILIGAHAHTVMIVFKIGPHLPKLLSNIRWHTLLRDSVLRGYLLANDTWPVHLASNCDVDVCLLCLCAPDATRYQSHNLWLYGLPDIAIKEPDSMQQISESLLSLLCLPYRTWVWCVMGYNKKNLSTHYSDGSRIRVRTLIR